MNNEVECCKEHEREHTCNKYVLKNKEYLSQIFFKNL